MLITMRLPQLRQLQDWTSARLLRFRVKINQVLSRAQVKEWIQLSHLQMDSRPKTKQLGPIIIAVILVNVHILVFALSRSNETRPKVKLCGTVSKETLKPSL